jgi:hypothetical protein
MTLRPAVQLAVATIVIAVVASPSAAGVAHGHAASSTAGPAVMRPAANPVGTYTINFMTQGSPMSLTLRIEKREDGSYVGQMSGENLPPLPITSIKETGNAIKITFTAPDNTEGTINIVVAQDNTISGDWSMTGDGSKISGKKSA